jgi:LacI family transcriptional regulator
LQALDENKIHVPQQISLLGFDDYIWNRYFSPSITAVAQSTYEMGKRAFELLQEIMGRKKGEELSEKHIRLITELRLRNSTARPPEAAPVAAVS